MVLSLLECCFVLGTEVLDTEHIVRGRNVREQRENNQPKADDVKAL